MNDLLMIIEVYTLLAFMVLVTLVGIGQVVLMIYYGLMPREEGGAIYYE